ncbi:Unknown protein [Striga hermonthica]|uniref:GIR1-like zinc ribbon domain-containing protein n=1 Tax=Striga hermonthica TaxID=68872 RepID=A0A9N7NWM9_STRHE|nr:Unknown protein [Striga hermonthica]
MSRRSGPRLDLKLNLSPPRRSRPRDEPPSQSPTDSPPTSCLSSEPSESLRHSTSPEEATSMMLVGCPRCLMYVMLSEEDQRCPKCKSTVLLDVIHDGGAAGRRKKKGQN